MIDDVCAGAQFGKKPVGEARDPGRAQIVCDLSPRDIFQCRIDPRTEHYNFSLVPLYCWHRVKFILIKAHQSKR